MLSLSLIFTAIILFSLAYIAYERFFHPLSSFPSPFLASFSNIWRFYHELRGDLPSVLHEYHKKYGSFIRVAPNEIDTDAAEVVEVVYKKGGRHYPKSEYYDGFTAIRPSIFGTRDENYHALRRRQMAHAFSQSSFVKMEYIFDRHVKALLEKLDARAKAGEAFSLGVLLRYFSYDANGDLSMGVQFGTQQADDPTILPPMNDHIALAKLTGYMPSVKFFVDRFGRYLPWPYLQKLQESRAWLKDQASRITDIEFERVGRTDTTGADLKEMKVDAEPDRINLFTSLVRASDPESGELLDHDDVTANAITFLTAGSHSTSATLEIVFWYFLHHPAVMNKVQCEVDGMFADPEITTVAQHDIVSIEGLETQLPYTSAVFKECFRLSPTFQSPAPRVTPATSDPRYPTVIAETVIPPGYAVSASVLSLHRNSTIWGSDADEFNPERWFKGMTREKEGLLMHFGAGHRACIGRNQAQIMVWKVVVEVIRGFELSLVEDNPDRAQTPKMVVRGFAELAGPLIVKARRRQMT